MRKTIITVSILLHALSGIGTMSASDTTKHSSSSSIATSQGDLCDQYNAAKAALLQTQDRRQKAQAKIKENGSELLNFYFQHGGKSPKGESVSKTQISYDQLLSCWQQEDAAQTKVTALATALIEQNAPELLQPFKDYCAAKQTLKESEADLKAKHELLPHFESLASVVLQLAFIEHGHNCQKNVATLKASCAAAGEQIKRYIAERLMAEERLDAQLRQCRIHREKIDNQTAEHASDEESQKKCSELAQQSKQLSLVIDIGYEAMDKPKPPSPHKQRHKRTQSLQISEDVA